ncbi:MAG TPA: gamma-glutamyltransferase [Arenibaculum sp.]|nr:gamma-glutamyltransferase [Arenibaculum sp.]
MLLQRLTAAFLAIMMLASGAPSVLAQEMARPAPEAATGFTPKASVEAGDFMVVAANPLAAEAGYRVLREGGGAVDAAIAVQLVLNLVEPQSSGIGGGAFLLHWDALDETLTAYDGRETAPAEAGPDLFLDPDGQPMEFSDAVIGGRSVGTPGTLRLLELVHRLHGRLPWERLFQPAIDRAEQGFEVSPRLAALIRSEADSLRRYPGTRGYFFGPDGEPLAAGARLRNPDFAATLRAVAERGADAFYGGDIARDIVRTVRQAEGNPGKLSQADLAGYRVAVRQPVCGGYRAYVVCGMGPPSSGGLTVLQILGMLEHFDMASLDPLSVDATHLFAEASRLAYADRALYMADADFVPMPVAGLLDPSYLMLRAQLIDRDAAIAEPEAGNPPWRDARAYAPDRSIEIPSTSHVSIVDGRGDIVSMTTTIEAGFGSRLMVRGFLLNNELTDFSFAAEQDGRPVANRVEPGKRPRSSMAPTFVFDRAGAPFLVTGSPGGARIIGYVARNVIGVVDWGLDPADAVALPHAVSLGGGVDLEEGTPIAGIEAPLEALGHTVDVRELNSGLHAIKLHHGKLIGGADPRREGMALGE